MVEGGKRELWKEQSLEILVNLVHTDCAKATAPFPLADAVERQADAVRNSS